MQRFTCVFMLRHVSITPFINKYKYIYIYNLTMFCILKRFPHVNSIYIYMFFYIT